MKISKQVTSPINSFDTNRVDNKFKDIYKSEFKKVEENTKEYSTSKVESSVKDIVSKHMDEKIKKDLNSNSKFYDDPIKELRNLWGYGNFDKFS